MDESFDFDMDDCMGDDSHGKLGLKKFVRSGAGTPVGDRLSPDIWISADRGDLEGLQSLAREGFNVVTPDNLGNTPLHYAAEQGHSAVVQYLVEIQPDINIRNHGGKTPLLLAAEKNRLSTARILVMKGADPRTRSSPDLYLGGTHSRVEAKTALDYAAEHDNAEMITLIESALKRWNGR